MAALPLSNGLTTSHAYEAAYPLRFADPTGKRRTDEIEADEQEYHEQKLEASGCDTEPTVAPARWLRSRT